MNLPITTVRIRTLLACLVLIGGLSVSACQGGASDTAQSDGAPAEATTETSSDVVSTMDAEDGEIVFDTSGELPAKKPAKDHNETAEESDSGSDG